MDLASKLNTRVRIEHKSVVVDPTYGTEVVSVDQITAASVTLELTTNSAGVGVIEVLAP